MKLTQREIQEAKRIAETLLDEKENSSREAIAETLWTYHAIKRVALNHIIITAQRKDTCTAETINTTTNF